MKTCSFAPPFDGTVISKDAEEGESIQPGGMGGTSGRGSVATIADLENLEIECDVQEDFISRVTEGQEADIAIDAVQSKKYHGVVRKIIPMGDRARATIKVQVTIRDADELLFPEMAGTVYFLPTEQDLETSEQPRLFCPTSAVDRDPQGNQFVWVADSQKLRQENSCQSRHRPSRTDGSHRRADRKRTCHCESGRTSRRRAAAGCRVGATHVFFCDRARVALCKF